MLTVTEKALGRLSTKLAGRNAGDDEAFRFAPQSNGWRLRVDRPRPADKAFSHDGRCVLLLDEAASDAMADMTLDVRKTQAGPRLKLHRRSNAGD